MQANILFVACIYQKEYVILQHRNQELQTFKLRQYGYQRNLHGEGRAAVQRPV